MPNDNHVTRGRRTRNSFRPLNNGADELLENTPSLLSDEVMQTWSERIAPLVDAVETPYLVLRAPSVEIGAVVLLKLVKWIVTGKSNQGSFEAFMESEGMAYGRGRGIYVSEVKSVAGLLKTERGFHMYVPSNKISVSGTNH